MTTPPEYGAHAASAPVWLFSSLLSSSGPRATANARTPSAMGTGAPWFSDIALPTTSFARSPIVSLSAATSARYAIGNSTSHCRSRIISFSSSSPSTCTLNAVGGEPCPGKSHKSFVWNKCTALPTTAPTVVSSGQKLTLETSFSGMRQKSGPGTICSAGSFSFKLSMTSASRDVVATHRPAWSANNVRP